MANCRRSRSPSTATRSCSFQSTCEHPNGDTRSQNQLLLHTVGASWPVQWVTIHDTAINGTDAFDANAPGKSSLAPHHSSGRRTGSSSLVHTFGPSSSSSLATQIIVAGTDLCWQHAAPGVESSASISTQTARLETSLSSSWATPTMLRLIISRSWMTKTRSW